MVLAFSLLYIAHVQIVRSEFQPERDEENTTDQVNKFVKAVHSTVHVENVRFLKNDSNGWSFIDANSCSVKYT